MLHRIATPIAAGRDRRRARGRGSPSSARRRWSTRSRSCPAGFAKPEPQDAAGATYAPKIDRDSARLDWRREAATVARQVRAFDPAPGAWATHDDVAAQAVRRACRRDDRGEPGRVLAAGERLVVGCGDGALAVREVQPAGKTRLAGERVGARPRHRRRGARLA